MYQFTTYLLWYWIDIVFTSFQMNLKLTNTGFWQRPNSYFRGIMKKNLSTDLVIFLLLILQISIHSVTGMHMKKNVIIWSIELFASKVCIKNKILDSFVCVIFFINAQSCTTLEKIFFAQLAWRIYGTTNKLNQIIAVKINIFPTLSAQRCRGTETFDKLTGITLRNAAQIPLFSSVGNTVTAECNNR